MSDTCKPIQRIVKQGDFNFDGQTDEIEKLIYDAKECSDAFHIRFGSSQETYKENPFYSNRVLNPRDESSLLHFSVQYWNFHATFKKGMPFLQQKDLVETPFGPYTQEKIKGRIVSFIFEFDFNLDWSRTLATVDVPYGDGLDWFDLSSLILISPFAFLEKRAAAFLKDLQNSKDYKKREKILKDTYFNNLAKPLQEEIKAIETRLALSLKSKIEALKLDPEGARIFVDRTAPNIGFHWSFLELTKASPPRVGSTSNVRSNY